MKKSFLLISLIDWRHIRGLGELQILTRASYLMLIVVPILAGLWPGVRIAINRYNEVITDARLAFQHASERLQAQAQQIDYLLNKYKTDLGNNEITNAAINVIHNVDSRLEHLLSDYSLKTIEQNTLPSVWALAFVASLIVILAHMFYQMWAPDLIRNTKIEEYALSRRNLHAENPSDGTVKRAIWYMEENDKFRESSLLVQRPPPDTKETNLITRWELDVVEKGAIAEYLVIASRNKPGAWITGILYSTGIIIVLYIAYNQTYAVFRAAGWVS